MQLRYYQQAAIDDLYAWMSHNSGSPLVIIPTAGGKSLCIAKIIQDVMTHWPDQRIICLTHVKELVSQNFAELKGVLPDVPAGIYSAGLGCRDDDAQILFASIQSIYKKAYKMRNQQCNLIMIDEAHLLSRDQSSMYGKFIADMREINGNNIRIVGFTATAYRLDSGWLHKGDDRIFDGIAHETKMTALIKDGYLSPLISKRTATRLNTSGVGMRGGDFIPSELEAACDQAAVTQSAVKEIIEFGQDRKSWIIFGTGTKHCTHIQEFLNESGISAECVFGDTDKEERDRIITEFKALKIRCLISVNVATVGFNSRPVDLIGMMRPTKSTSLYVQMVGRGCRLSPETGKTNCLVLDFVGNAAYHGPVDTAMPREKKKGQGSGEAPTKKCDNCEERLHTSVMECPYCGYIFPEPKINISAKASDDPILSTEKILHQIVSVTSLSFKLNNPREAGKPPTLKVTYHAGMVEHNAFWCFEHRGYPREKAVTEWIRHGGQIPPPATIKEALERSAYEIRKPASIAVKKPPGSRYTEIVGIDHGRT